MAWLLSDFDNTKWIHRDINGYYCDPQNGNDLNDGHPERSYKSIEQLEIDNGLLKFLYISPSKISVLNTIRSRVRGDVRGLVLLDGLSLGSSMFGLALSVENVTIQNLTSLCNAANGQSVKFKNCTFKNVQYTGVAAFNALGQILDTATFENCIFDNCQDIYCRNFINCDFVNGSILKSRYLGFVKKIINCDFDSTSLIETSVTGFFVNTLFDYCNVRCDIDGVTASAYKSANQGQLQNSKTSPDDNATNDPERLNEASGDYSLSLTSPNRNTASNGLHIGSVGVGVGAFGLADFTNFINAQWNVDKWEQIDPLLKATIESAVKDLQDVYSVNLCSVFGFNDNVTNNHIDETLPYSIANVPSGSILAGKTYIVKGYSNVQYNGNDYAENETFIGAVGFVNYTTTGTGTVNEITELPDQRVLEIRYSSISVGDVASQPYKRYIIGVGLINDILGVGIGESTFDFNNQTQVQLRFFQMKISMLKK